MMAVEYVALFCSLLQCSFIAISAASYSIDDVKGLGRRFDGIGGLSGGGATSRLLVSYSDPYRSQILDYLFTPNFGASLHMLKVEIGGDAQSGVGTEPSHMHSPDDENYQRGYEWWLMKEAKKRNPDIKLYGLPWGWPGWVGNYTSSPYTDIQKAVGYVIKWLQGAKQVHGLTIDYVGVWNERAYNKSYIELLRHTLDLNGMGATQLVAADAGFSISKDVLTDHDLARAVSILGFHYPGTYVTNYTLQTGKPLWSSEDFSTFNDEVGTGCWARVLNQNYVNGNMTSTISWNLIASYYQNLPFYRDGLMTAVQPWSGNYVVEGPIWISAHTTQFNLPGWRYYKHGSGAGHLDHGGSYVSLTDGKHITIVIETMSHDHSKCIRPPLGPYNVETQTANFTLKGTFASIESLNVFYSKPGFEGNASVYFIKKSPVQVINGQFSLTIHPDEVYTLTTQTVGVKGKHPDPPLPKPFPVPYSDNFEVYPVYSEASYFADQAGCFEIRASGDPTHGQVMEQVATSYPVNWCDDLHYPITLIGNASWTNTNFSIDVRVMPSSGVVLGFRVGEGGCKMAGAEGVFFWLLTNGTHGGTYKVSTDAGGRGVVKSGISPLTANTWSTVTLTANGGKATGSVNSKQVFQWDSIPGVLPKSGFIVIGTTDYTPTQLDNFHIHSAS